MGAGVEEVRVEEERVLGVGVGVEGVRVGEVVGLFLFVLLFASTLNFMFVFVFHSLAKGLFEWKSLLQQTSWV